MIKAAFLPLSALETGSDFSAWLSFLQVNKLTGWAMLPIHEPAWSPYRNSGFGVLNREQLWTDLSAAFSEKDLAQFRQRLIKKNSLWLDGQALFLALADNFQTTDWSKWPRAVRLKEPEVLAQFKTTLKEQIVAHYQRELANLLGFYCLRQLTRAAKIKLIGDCPFYVGQETFTTWWWQELFDLDERHLPTYYSGVPDHPKEPFVRQIWAHPLYHWSKSQTLTEQNQAIVDLFVARLKFLNQFFDWVRLDHVNGFFRYGALHPAQTEPDDLRVGPGAVVLQDLTQKVKKLRLKIFFEDIAADDYALQRFMSRYGFPGMNVLTMGFDERHLAWHEEVVRLDRTPENKVLYSSTHDTPTLFGWLREMTTGQRQQLLKLNRLPLTEQNLDPAQMTVILRQKILAQKQVPLVIIPVQDFLLEDRRLNVPGTPDEENWQYQLKLLDGVSS